MSKFSSRLSENVLLIKFNLINYSQKACPSQDNPSIKLFSILLRFLICAFLRRSGKNYRILIVKKYEKPVDTLTAFEKGHKQSFGIPVMIPDMQYRRCMCPLFIDKGLMPCYLFYYGCLRMPFSPTSSLYPKNYHRNLNQMPAVSFSYASILEKNAIPGQPLCWFYSGNKPILSVAGCIFRGASRKRDFVPI